MQPAGTVPKQKGQCQLILTTSLACAFVLLMHFILMQIMHTSFATGLLSFPPMRTAVCPAVPSTLLYSTLLYSTLAAVQTRSRMLVRQPVHTRLGVPCHVSVKTACSLNLLQGHQSRRRACSTDCKQARLHLAAKLNFASR